MSVELEDEVSDKDLATIARDHLSNWESLRPYLELSHAQKEEIRRSCPGDYGKQKQECLEVWKQTKGNEATYCALITAAEDAKQQTLADGVRSLLTSRQNIPPPDMKGVYMQCGEIVNTVSYCNALSSGVATSHQLRADGSEPLPHVSLLTTQQVASTPSKCGFMLGYNRFSTSTIVQSSKDPTHASVM